MMKQVLSGTKVIDFTRHMAGPYATVTLADFGADVIKVEAVPSGDPSRQLGTAFVGDQAAPFLIWNRGKRSVALNLRTEDGLEVVRRLVNDADVVVENYRPGVAERIGIGYEQLSTLNPQLIYCSISAFGPDGPLASYPGTDPIVQAMSGVMSVTGEPNGEPVLTGVPIADFTGAMLGVQGILLALITRAQTGKGQKVDVSMLLGLMSSLTTRLGSYWATGVDPVPQGSAHSTLVPFQAFQTADGYAVAGTWGGDSWPKFCEAVGRPQLAEDTRFASSIDRAENKEELVALLREIFRSRTTSEWEQRFQEAGALFAPILKFSEILTHPQVRAAGMVQTVEHASLGELPQLGPAVHLSETPGRIPRGPPLFGQHTEEVLREVGYESSEINDLVAHGTAAVPARDAGL